MLSYNFQVSKEVNFYQDLILQISNLWHPTGFELIFSKGITTRLLWHCYKKSDFRIHLALSLWLKINNLKINWEKNWFKICFFLSACMSHGFVRWTLNTFSISLYQRTQSKPTDWTKGEWKFLIQEYSGF